MTVLDPSDLARQIEALTITSKERYISSTPERILDAPDLIDDFCQFLISWPLHVSHHFVVDVRFESDRLGQSIEYDRCRPVELCVSLG